MDTRGNAESSSVPLMAIALAWLGTVIGENFHVLSQRNGSYNWNLIIAVSNQHPVVLRVPKPNPRQLDLRQSHEASVLREVGRVAALAPHIPQLLAEGPHGLMVIEYVGAHTLDSLAPKTTPLMAFELAQLAGVLTNLHARSNWRTPHLGHRRAAPEFVGGNGTYERQREHFLLVWSAAWKRHSRMLERIGLPEPQDFLRLTAHDMQRRRDTVVHGDIHRKNIRTDRVNEVLFLLDWETAFVGDPVYDVAVALHKLQLPHEQSELLLGLWQHALEPDAINGWAADMEAFSAFLKSRTACLEFLRSLDSWRGCRAGVPERRQIAEKYSGQVNAAAAVLGYSEIDEGSIARILDDAPAD